MARNIVTLKKFFEKDSRPVQMTEMKEFWAACTEQEKDDFCAAAEKQLGLAASA